MKVWFLVIMLYHNGGVAVETLGPFATEPACKVGATIVEEQAKSARSLAARARCVPVDQPKETLQ